MTLKVRRGEATPALTTVLDAAEAGGRTSGRLGIRTATPGRLPLGQRCLAQPAALPVLDGGQLLLLAAEAATGRPVPERVRSAATRLSVGLLVTLLLLVTASDLHGLLAPARP